MSAEYLDEMMEKDPRSEKMEKDEEVDLDWIELENGWQLVICDEEAWAEMGLNLAGFSRRQRQKGESVNRQKGKFNADSHGSG